LGYLARLSRSHFFAKSQVCYPYIEQLIHKDMSMRATPRSHFAASKSISFALHWFGHGPLALARHFRIQNVGFVKTGKVGEEDIHSASPFPASNIRRFGRCTQRHDPGSSNDPLEIDSMVLSMLHRARFVPSGRE
jgi:hypothetical protein